MGSRVRPEVQPLSTTGQICNLGQVTWHNEAPILLSIKNWKDCIYLQFPERIKQDGPSEAFTFWSRQQWRLMAGGPTPSTPHARLKHTAMIDDFFFFFWLHWVCVAARGLLSGCSAWALHCCDLCCCRALALGIQASIFVAMGLVTPPHVGSSQTRNWTCVPCLGRQIPKHWTTREVPWNMFLEEE